MQATLTEWTDTKAKISAMLNTAKSDFLHQMDSVRNGKHLATLPTLEGLSIIPNHLTTFQHIYVLQFIQWSMTQMLYIMFTVPKPPPPPKPSQQLITVINRDQQQQTSASAQESNRQSYQVCTFEFGGLFEKRCNAATITFWKNTIVPVRVYREFQTLILD